MKLTAEQTRQFDEQGYLFLPEVFEPAEVGVLMDQVPGIFAQERDEVWREKDGKAVRTAFAAGKLNGDETLKAKVRLTIEGLDLAQDIDGQISLT